MGPCQTNEIPLQAFAETVGKEAFFFFFFLPLRIPSWQDGDLLCYLVGRACLRMIMILSIDKSRVFLYRQHIDS